MNLSSSVLETGDYIISLGFVGRMLLVYIKSCKLSRAKGFLRCSLL